MSSTHTIDASGLVASAILGRLDDADTVDFELDDVDVSTSLRIWPSQSDSSTSFITVRTFEGSSGTSLPVPHLTVMPVKPPILTTLSGRSGLLSMRHWAKIHGTRISKHDLAVLGIEARIVTLRQEAIEDHIELSLESISDAREFAKGEAFTCRPYVTLLDNGNLRLLWKNAHGELIGLQFLGGGMIQYVMFARRPGNSMARSSGRDTLEVVQRLITAHNLQDLLTAA